MSLYFINRVGGTGFSAIAPLSCSHPLLPLVATAWAPTSPTGGGSILVKSSAAFRVLISTTEGDCIAFIEKKRSPTSMSWHPRRKALLVGWEDGSLSIWSSPVADGSTEAALLAAAPDSPEALLLSRAVSSAHSAAVGQASKTSGSHVQNTAVMALGLGGKPTPSNGGCITTNSPAFVFVGHVDEVAAAATSHSSTAVGSIQWSRNGKWGVTTSHNRDVIVWLVEETKRQVPEMSADGKGSPVMAPTTAATAPTLGRDDDEAGVLQMQLTSMFSVKCSVNITGVCHVPSTERQIVANSPKSHEAAATKNHTAKDASAATTAEDEIAFILCGGTREMWFLDYNGTPVSLLSTEPTQRVLCFLYDPVKRLLVTLTSGNMVEVYNITEDFKSVSRMKGKVSAPSLATSTGMTTGGTISSCTAASLDGLPGVSMSWAAPGLVVIGCGDERVRFFSIENEVITSLLPPSYTAAVTSANMATASTAPNTAATTPATSPTAESGAAGKGSTPPAAPANPAALALPTILGTTAITSISTLPQRRMIAVGTAEGVVVVFGCNAGDEGCQVASAWEPLALLTAHSGDTDTQNGDALRQKLLESSGVMANPPGSAGEGNAAATATNPSRRHSSSALVELRVDGVRWTAQGDIAVCYSGGRFKLMREAKRQRVWDGVAAATQVTSAIVVIESITGCQCLLASTSKVRGLSLSFPHIALWNGSVIELYTINETTSVASLINFVSTSSGAFALHSSGLLYVRSGNRVQFVNLQMQPIAHITFTESEGEVVILDVMEDFMVAITDKHVMKLAKINGFELRQLGPARVLFRNNEDALAGDAAGAKQEVEAAEDAMVDKNNEGRPPRTKEPEGPITVVDAKVNAQGKRVALMTRVGVLQRPDSRIWVYDSDTDNTVSYDFGPSNEQPESLYWNRPASDGNSFGELGYLLLACETHGVKVGKRVGADDGKAESTSSSMRDEKGVTVIEEEVQRPQGARGGYGGSAAGLNSSAVPGQRPQGNGSLPSPGPGPTPASGGFNDGYGEGIYDMESGADGKGKIQDMENLVEKEKREGEALNGGVSSGGAVGCYGLQSSQHNLVTLFATTTSQGIVKHNSVPMQRYQICLVGLTIPDFLLASVRIGGNAGSPADYVIEQKRLRDFDGLKSDRDVVVREALMKFSYYATIGNMDEAYRAVKSIKSSSVWHNLATMCVSNGRLDVAEVCLAQLLDGVGARALREAKENYSGEKDVQLAVLAYTLGMVEESEQLLQKAKRYDLITELFVACGLFDQANRHALKYDRIHARAVAYKCAQFQEGLHNFDSAIYWYHTARCAGTDVARVYQQRGTQGKLREIVMKTANDPATAEAISTKELLCWLAAYSERRQRMSDAVSYYGMAKDHYNVVRLLMTAFTPPRVDDALDVVSRLVEAAVELEAKNQQLHGGSRPPYPGGLEDNLTGAQRGEGGVSGVVPKSGLPHSAGASSLSQPIGAAYFVGLHFEKMNDIDSALKYYGYAGAYRRAVVLAKETKRLSELLQFSLQSNDHQLMLRSAYFLEECKAYDKAVVLLRTAGETMHAIDVCVAGSLFDALVQISEDLNRQVERQAAKKNGLPGDGPVGPAVDPDIFRQMSKYFAGSKGYENRAAEMLILAKDYDDALKLCLEKSVTMTEEMADAMLLIPPPTPPTSVEQQRVLLAETSEEHRESLAKKFEAERVAYEEAKRTFEEDKLSMYKKVAHVAKEQQSWSLACKYYTLAGDRLKAVKALLRTGDNDKIVFFANHSRSADIYVMTANYLQSQDWIGNPSIHKSIVHFYTKAKALSNLASFYDMCAQVYIDENRNYDLALTSLQSAATVLEKLLAESHNDGPATQKKTGSSSVSYAVRLDETHQRGAIVARVAKAKKLFAPGTTSPELISICSDLVVKYKKSKKHGGTKDADEHSERSGGGTNAWKVDPASAPFSAHLIESAIRMGDVYTLLVQYYCDGVKEYRNGFSVLEAMQKEGISVKLYVEASIVSRVCDANGKSPAPFLQDDDDEGSSGAEDGGAPQDGKSSGRLKKTATDEHGAALESKRRKKSKRSLKSSDMPGEGGAMDEEIVDE